MLDSVPSRSGLGPVHYFNAPIDGDRVSDGL